MKRGSLVRVTGPGMVKVGDYIAFVAGEEEKIERAVLVLNPGTGQEEIIWDKKENKYLITVNVLDDGKYASPYLRNFRVLRPAAPSHLTKENQE